MKTLLHLIGLQLTVFVVCFGMLIPFLVADHGWSAWWYLVGSPVFVLMCSSSDGSNCFCKGSKKS
jgi:hypothetical protein